VADEALPGWAAAVVPVCLVLIGLSLAYYGVQGQLRGGAHQRCSSCCCCRRGAGGRALGLRPAGLPLAVVVMMAALPVGSNALIFASATHAAGRGHGGHRRVDGGLRGHLVALAGRAGAAGAGR
jgi:malonate transporter and related proteins